MANSSNYRVQLRRRREGKTDYQARKAMVISGKPRLVTRPTIKNMTVQILIAKPHGDEILAAANSRELIKAYGWKAATGNIPAAYLTGYLCGLKAKAKGVTDAILDLGLNPPIKGSKIFAALSGIVDAGIEVPHSEDKIVKGRMKGDHIAKYAKSLGTGSDETPEKFSQYTANGVAPEKISEHFNKTKAAIAATFKVTLPVEEEAEEEEEFEEFEEEEKPEPKAPKAKAAKSVEAKPEVKSEAKAPKETPKEAKEEAPSAKKAPAKKSAAKKEEIPAEEKTPAKKAAKKPKEEAPIKEEKAAKTPKAKATKEKAPKEEPKKATKKGEKKA